MERNEKQQISVKKSTISKWAQHNNTRKAAFKNIFIQATCFCKHENNNFMKSDKILEI